MNKEFRDFANEIRDHIFEDAGDRKHLNIQLSPVHKVNEQEQLSLQVRPEGSNIAPSIPLMPVFEEYKKGEPLDKIIRSLEETVLSHTPPKDVDISYFANFENVKDQIYPKLINRQMNSEILQNMPHYDMGDLSTVFYVNIDHPLIKEGRVTVTEEIMHRWGVDENTLMDHAMENIKGNTVCKGMFDVIKDLVPVIEEENGFVAEDLTQPVVISNDNSVYGASAILNTDAMKTLCERFGGEVAILPSSLHECLVLPFDGTPEQEMLLCNMVKEVNETAVSPADLLSDHVYHFDGEQYFTLDMSKTAEEHDIGAENAPEKVKMELTNPKTGKTFDAEKNEKLKEAGLSLSQQKDVTNIAARQPKRDEMAM